MKPLETLIVDGLRWGPFQTSFHQNLVDDDFRKRLTSFVARNARDQLTVNPDRVKGSFVATYDEERYTGPNSVVKYPCGQNIGPTASRSAMC